jgi:hypothetical protein
MALEDLLREALDEFLAREFPLVRKNIHEQALCGRLARYVEVSKDKRGLHQYYVDVEYDRHGDRRKTICSARTGKPVNIVCDLLLHSRGEQENDNLIAVEMKKTSGRAKDKQTDRERLQALTTAHPEGGEEHVWDYELGYYLEVDVKHATLLVEEYREGKMAQSETLPFTQPERSRSDSGLFARRESRAGKSARAKS